LYPDHAWQLWKFPQPVPAGFWNRVTNQRAAFDDLATFLGIKEMSDWYRVTLKNFTAHAGSSSKTCVTLAVAFDPGILIQELVVW
jgi:hypothetical protein